MLTVVYLVSAVLLLAAAYLVFRIIVRRDYQRRERLTPLSSALELLIWGLFVFFPYIYNPDDWALLWFGGDMPASTLQNIVGSAFTIIGIAAAGVAMAMLGIRKSFGRKVKGLQESDFYRLSRNPQIVGCALMVTGVTILWPSWYALGWVLMYAAIAHMMVLTEEEHLQNVFGDEYARYCERVPRYLGPPGRV